MSSDLGYSQSNRWSLRKVLMGKSWEPWHPGGPHIARKTAQDSKAPEYSVVTKPDTQVGQHGSFIGAL